MLCIPPIRVPSVLRTRGYTMAGARSASAVSGRRNGYCFPTQRDIWHDVSVSYHIWLPQRTCNARRLTS